MVFYNGPRPVLKGRSTANFVHPFKGVGTYSNWSLYSTDHVLDGAPTTNVSPGAGLYPHDLAMSRWYMGLRTTWPLDNSGGGTRIVGMRYRPLEYKGTDGQGVFSGSWGHEDRVTSYSFYDQYNFDGVTSSETMTNVGHARRSSGGAATFGAFDPLVYKGVSPAFDSTYGQAVPAGYDHSYGHNRVGEHRGVPSATALSV